jgi:DNA-binding XRE family transcriptional regulator
MSEARARLNSLVELATQNAPEKRRELAIELCDLLLDWPANYPAQMREPFEALLEKTIRLIDRDTRHVLIARIAGAPGVRREFLNEFFFDAPPDLRGTILERNSHCEINGTPAVDESALVNAARNSDEFADTFAQHLGVASETAARIVSDASAQSLALAIKGAHLNRATFSALVLLVCPGKPSNIETRLAAFDTVDEPAAAAMLSYWRGRTHAHAEAA